MSDLKSFDIQDFKKGQNLFVEASAGTGKTFTIRKIVAKLVEEGIPLSKILLVTYTEKAAGELRDRIRQEMEEGTEKGVHVELFTRALAEVDNASIGTIHAFCQKTLHDFAVESHVPFDMQMAGDGVVENMVDRLIRDAWEFPIAEQSLPVKQIRELLIRSVERYDDSLVLQDQIASDLGSWIKWNPEFETHLERLRHHSSESFTIQKVRLGKVSESSIPVSKMLGEVEDRVQSNKWSKISETSFGKETVDADSAEVIATTNYFRNLKPYILEKEDADKIVFVLGKLKSVYAAYQAEKLANKQQSFNDMIRLVQKAVLADDSALCRKLREMYRYAIIDEFQDTNQAQWDIFKKVFLDSKENHLIVVGDPKQSIYSFQSADLNVYFSAIRSNHLEGRSLSVNYRSTNAMIHACNAMFQKPFFGESEAAIQFTPSKTPSEISDSNSEVPSPTWDGKQLKPVFIAQGSSDDFEKFAAERIVEFCEKDAQGKTRLQVYDKELKTFRNVKFSNIAILGRTRGELAEMESVLSQVGIPFTRYKDSNLFKGRECAQWISLLRAIDAPDFSGRRRGILNTALISDFFRITIADLDSKNWEDPRNPVLFLFAKWRSLAKNYRWSELQENIYSETQIDKFLCESSKLQNLAKVKQIGTYIFDYLYNNRVSLNDAVRHLEGLAERNDEADEEDGNLVSKGSDFDAVQLMTIHASKGLQFPVVISLAGIRKSQNNMQGPFVYTDAENRKVLGLDNVSRNSRRVEELEEWRRLLYVDYTRAESLLIAPLYAHWFKEGVLEKSGEFAFLAEAEMALPEEFRESFDVNSLEWDRDALKSRVNRILESLEEANVLLEDEKLYRQKILALDKSLPQKSIFSYSYSSLSGHGDSNDVTKDGSRENPDDESLDDSKMLEIDLNPVRILSNSPTETIPAVETVEDFPHGRLLGNAMHAVFEKMDFEHSGDWKSEEAAQKDSAFKTLIEEEFQKQGYEIQSKPEWVLQMAKFVYHTMHAELPEIHGSASTGKTFALKTIPSKNRLAEMEFHLKANDADKVLHQFCKGFMDVLFVRGEYFSILDWKSDVIPNYGVMNDEGDGTEATVDHRYAVQRVLYSYCLIQWLKFFGNFGESEEEIFEKHFGGVYYVFARGCRAGESSGLYAQTWKNYHELEKEYLVLKKAMRA